MTFHYKNYIRSIAATALLGLSIGTTYPTTPTEQNSTAQKELNTWEKAQIAASIALSVGSLIGLAIMVNSLTNQMNPNKASRIDPSKLPIPEDRFSDCSGIVPQQIRDIVDYIKDPSVKELYKKFPILGVCKGVLLFGPPGTGKTQLVRSLAGEAGVPFYSYNGSSFLNPYVGASEANIREIFNTARKAALHPKNPHKLAIVFIDEIDGIGAKRNPGERSNHGSIMAELLAQIDGFDRNTNLIVIGATNRKELLDDALIRPGRLEMHIYVDNPPLEGVQAIIKHYLDKLPFEGNKEAILKTLAQKAEGKSAATLEFYIKQACRIAIRAKKDALTDQILTDAFDRELKKEREEKERKEQEEREQTEQFFRQRFGGQIPQGLSLRPRRPRGPADADIKRVAHAAHAQAPTLGADTPLADG